MLAGGVAATAFTIVPRHALGGAGFVLRSATRSPWPASALGTQAIRETAEHPSSPDVQVVAVCDVEKDGVNYLEWSKNDIRDNGNPGGSSRTRPGREGSDHAPGGRDVGKEIVETMKTRKFASRGIFACCSPTLTSASCWKKRRT